MATKEPGACLLQKFLLLETRGVVGLTTVSSRECSARVTSRGSQGKIQVAGGIMGTLALDPKP